ncbi:hypothetical protein [Streptomyces sp. NPDC006368]|uniref:hypothetical protein n=1 Tax=Streptomyces sp. NPDC006368 TaxID=3156760 RepID=UPI0033AC4270
MTYGAVRALRDRGAGPYPTGVVVCGFGSAGMWLVAGVWGTSLTGPDALAALTVFALWAPLLAGPAPGAAADRTRRRPLLVRPNPGMAALLPALLLVTRPGGCGRCSRAVRAPNAPFPGVGAVLVTVVGVHTLLPLLAAPGPAAAALGRSGRVRPGAVTPGRAAPR